MTYQYHIIDLTKSCFKNKNLIYKFSSENILKKAIGKAGV